MTIRFPMLSRFAKATAYFLVLLVVVKTAFAATVRGGLVRRGPNGAQYPAGGVAVTLYNQAAGRSNPAFAGPDGMYYLYNVRPGSYYLEVWTSRDPRIPPTVYPIQVGDPYTDIPVIIVP